MYIIYLIHYMYVHFHTCNIIKRKYLNGSLKMGHQTLLLLTSFLITTCACAKT